mmetsp:Transcript_41028/g.62409  ORF Transcript_41028/g.62409 Transcript_41028/m.62409 type:complete len:243 (-) Transcript_41028:167-895(-)
MLGRHALLRRILLLRRGLWKASWELQVWRVRLRRTLQFYLHDIGVAPLEDSIAGRGGRDGGRIGLPGRRLLGDLLFVGLVYFLFVQDELVKLLLVGLVRHWNRDLSSGGLPFEHGSGLVRREHARNLTSGTSLKQLREEGVLFVLVAVDHFVNLSLVLVLILIVDVEFLAHFLPGGGLLCLVLYLQLSLGRLRNALSLEGVHYPLELIGALIRPLKEIYSRIEFLLRIQRCLVACGPGFARA